MLHTLIMIRGKITQVLLVFLLTSFAQASCDKHFLTIYNNITKTEISRPLERFARPLGHLFNVLQKHQGHPDLLIREIMDEDIRRHVFLVEGLLKIYLKSGKKSKVTKRIFNKVKNLEDKIGSYSLNKGLADYANSIKLESEIIEYLRAHEDESYSELKQVLSVDWGHDQVQVLVEKLIKIDSKNDISSKDLIKKYFLKSLSKLEEKDFDLNELEDGIHELRRSMRWVLINIQALQGQVNFHPGNGNSSIKRFNQIVNDPDFKDDHYSKFYISDKENDPILISRPYFLALGKATREIGNTKDNGELFLHLTDAYIKTGLFPDQKQAFDHVVMTLQRNGIVLEDWKAEAQRMVDFLKGLEGTSKENLYQLLLEEFDNN